MATFYISEEKRNTFVIIIGFWSYDAKIKMNLEDKSLSDYINQKVPMRGLYEMHLELKFKDSTRQRKKLDERGESKRGSPRCTFSKPE